MSEPVDDDYSMKFDESAAETLPATGRSERERERTRDRDTSASIAVDASLVNALYAGLKKGGYIGQVKTQLRNRIVQELRERAASHRVVSKKLPQDGISARVANSIVLQHLRACQYEYSVSIFVPECGLDGDTHSVSTSELLELLRIDRESSLAKRVLASGERNFLLSLVRLMLESVSTVGKVEPLDGIEPVGVGATERSGEDRRGRARKTLAEKFDEIDRAYESKHTTPTHDTDFADEAVRRKLEVELEERFRKAFEFETARFRELELERIRKEQFEHYRTELERARRAARDEFDAKLRSETESCRAQVEKVRAEADARERELFVSRQKLLADTSTLADRHATLDRDRELFEKQRKMEEARWASAMEEVGERERAIGKRESEFESRVSQRVALRCSELESSYRDKLAEVESIASRTRADAQRTESERRVLEELRTRLTAKQGLLSDIELQSYAQVRDALAARDAECATLHDAVAAAERREAALRERIESLNCEARTNGDAANSARDSLAQLTIVSRERDSLRDAFDRDSKNWSHERDALLRRLSEESRERERTRAAFDDERDRRMALQKTINELSAELQLARSTTRTPRTPRASSAGRSRPEVAALRLSLSRTDDADGADMDADVAQSNGPADEYADEMIIESRVRLRALENEAASLERAYRDLTHRLGDAGPPYTPTPTSLKLSAPARRSPLTFASATQQQPASAKSGGSSSRRAESVASGAQSAGSGAPLSTSTAHLPVVVSFDLPFSTSLTTTGTGTGAGTSLSSVAHPRAAQPSAASQIVAPPAGSGLPTFSVSAATSAPVPTLSSAVSSITSKAPPNSKPTHVSTSTWSDGTLTSLTNPNASTLFGFGGTLGFDQAASERRSVSLAPSLPAVTANTAAPSLSNAAVGQSSNAAGKQKSSDIKPQEKQVSAPTTVTTPIQSAAEREREQEQERERQRERELQRERERERERELEREREQERERQRERELQRERERERERLSHTPTRSEADVRSGRTETQSDEQLPTVVDLDALWNDGTSAPSGANVPRSAIAAGGAASTTPVETPKKQVRIADARAEPQAQSPAKQPDVVLREEPEIDPAMRKYMELIAQQRTPTATLTGSLSVTATADMDADLDVETDSERRPSAKVPALDLDFDNSTTLSTRRTDPDPAGADDNSASDDKFW